MTKKILFKIFFVIYLTVNLCSLVTAASVTAIYPLSGCNDTTITLRVWGAGFNSSTSVLLRKSGQPDIITDNIVIKTSNHLTCSVNLSGKNTGSWDVVVGTSVLKNVFFLATRLQEPITVSLNNIIESQGGLVIGWQYASEFVIADGDNNELMEVYAIASYAIYQFKKINNTWQETKISTSILQGFSHMAIDDSDNDGKVEIINSFNQDIRKTYWDGTNWQTDKIATFPDIIDKIVIGDGDNDGKKEIYLTCRDYNIYQLQHIGTNWVSSIIGNVNEKVVALVIGDADNNGTQELYGGSLAGIIYQISWNGTKWVNKIIGGDLDNEISYLQIGGLDSNDSLKLYVSLGTGITQFTYSTVWGGDWEKKEIPSLSSDGFVIGDVDTNGFYELYGMFPKQYNTGYSGGIYYELGRYTARELNPEIKSFNLGNAGEDRIYYRCLSIGDGNNDGRMEIYYTFHNETNFEKGISEISYKTISQFDIIDEDIKVYDNIVDPLRGEKVPITYKLVKDSRILIDIYTIRGKFVRKLVNESQSFGIYQIEWDCIDNKGSTVGNGTYIIRMNVNGKNTFRKVVVIKK